jgi:hypothetical protein
VVYIKRDGVKYRVDVFKIYEHSTPYQIVVYPRKAPEIKFEMDFDLRSDCIQTVGEFVEENMQITRD